MRKIIIGIVLCIVIVPVAIAGPEPYQGAYYGLPAIITILHGEKEAWRDGLLLSLLTSAAFFIYIGLLLQYLYHFFSIRIGATKISFSKILSVVGRIFIGIVSLFLLFGIFFRITDSILQAILSVMGGLYILYFGVDYFLKRKKYQNADSRIFVIAPFRIALLSIVYILLVIFYPYDQWPNIVLGILSLVLFFEYCYRVWRLSKEDRYQYFKELKLFLIRMVIFVVTYLCIIVFFLA